jgi:hypothetical protein
MLIDVRFDIISFFLLWAAMLLTVLVGVAFVRGASARALQTASAFTILLWAAGSLIPVLT